MAKTLSLTREATGAGVTLRLQGAAVQRDISNVWRQVETELHDNSGGSLTLDLSAVSEADSAAAALIIFARRQCGEARRPFQVEGVGAGLQQLLDLIHQDTLYQQAPRPARLGPIEFVGDYSLRFWAETREMLAFVGEVTIAFVAALRRPRSVRWRDTLYYMDRCGSDAVPIMTLISFLVGVVLCFLGYVQLHKFGSDIFIADGVAYGMARVFGPLMVAILVAGRSGSAFASEIGAMKVAQEVDALETMGLDRARFLVVPKVLGLVLVMPILTLYADLAGILGGFVVGVMGMGLPAEMYLTRTVNVLTIWSVASGLVKSLAYAALISTVGCLRGLQTKQGPQAVGEVTTSSVVTSLFLIVIAESTFSICFYYLGL